MYDRYMNVNMTADYRWGLIKDIEQFSKSKGQNRFFIGKKCVV